MIPRAQTGRTPARLQIQLASNAKKELNKLIKKGVKSIGWDFSTNIQKAKEENHPEIDKVIEYAEKISGNNSK